jgi:hypothetical protein
MDMTLAQFRAYSAAEARRQKRLQVNACVAARSAKFDGKDFDKLMKRLADD